MNWFFRAIIVLASAGLIVGCTGEKEATITILISPDHIKGWKAIGEAFSKKYPNLKVNFEAPSSSTDDRQTKYTTCFLAEDAAYDLVYMDIIWVPKFASKGWLEPLDDKFPESARADFLPGDIEGSIYKGKIYRVPMQSDAGMLYFRKDLLEKAKLKPPQTFSELMRACTKLQKKPDLYGYVFQGKQYEGLVCNFLEILWGYGGDVFDSDGKLVINSPEAVKALGWLVDAVRNYQVCPMGVTTYNEEECHRTFQEGHAVFMRNWPYAWSMTQQEGSPVKGKVGIVPMVHAAGKKSAATLGGWGIGISKFSNNKKEAWKFIEFATSAPIQKLLHEREGLIPTRKSLFKDKDILEKSPHYGKLYKVLLGARPRPVHERYTEISDIMQKHLSASLIGDETPRQAARLMAVEIEVALGQK
ncbi:MAG: ABC transporter substrate-binding protein [Planctomycetota bacterium]|nr:MAG: ABC transporter substrate-binding protein [Planctomycetota bacterium]